MAYDDFDEPMPYWATGKAFGRYMLVGAQLCTSSYAQGMAELQEMLLLKKFPKTKDSPR